MILKKKQKTADLFNRFLLFYLENRMYQNYFSSKPIFTYIGSANSRNLGDVLLYKAIQKAFKHVLLIPYFPTSTIKNPRLLDLVDRAGTWAFQGLRSPSAIMLGGGTLLNNSFFFNLLKQHYQPDLPLIIFGTGMQDLEYWGDHLEKELAVYRTAQFFTVRNPYAAKVLAERGIKATAIGDPVLYLCKPRNQKQRRNRIGINVGCDRYKTLVTQKEINQVIAVLAKRLIERGFEVEFLAMHDNDAEDIKLIRQMDGLQKTWVWEDYKNWQAFLEKIHDFDLVIGQRLHAVITACGSGIPAISLSYRPKCLHFMESVNMEKYCLQGNRLDIEVLLSMVDEVNINYNEIRAQLLPNTEHYRNQIYNCANTIMGYLGN